MPTQSWWRCGDQSPLSCGNSSIDMKSSAERSPTFNWRDRFHNTVKSPTTSYSIPKNMQTLMHGIMSPIMSCVTPPASSSSVYEQDDDDESYIFMPISEQDSQQAASKASSLPMNNIETCHIHCNDVLCSRGTQQAHERSGGSSDCPSQHVGNRNLRALVAANRDAYVRLSTKQRQDFARSIVDLIHSAKPPGRFLVRDSMTGLWNDIGVTKSMERTTEAFREIIDASNHSHTSDTGSLSVFTEDKSAAPTVVSESLASVSTTPASNNSICMQQVFVPPSLKHVFRKATPQPIPTCISQRQKPKGKMASSSQYRSHEHQQRVTPTSACHAPLPMSPESPYGTISHFPVETPFSHVHQTSSLPPPLKRPQSEPHSPGSLPSSPPPIWRVYDSSVSSLPDIVEISQSVCRR